MSEFKNRSVSNTVKSRVEQSSIAVCTGDNELYEKFLKNSDNSNIAGYSSNTFSDVDFTKNTDSKVLNVPNKPLNIINFDCSPVIEESTYSGENANPISRYTLLTSPIIHTKGNDRRFNRWTKVDNNMERFVISKSLIPVNTHLTALNEHVSVCDKYRR